MLNGWPHVIHFHNLCQKRLNQLLKLSHGLGLSCCYLGHRPVAVNDLLLISSSTKLNELKKIRSDFSNWIFLVLEEPLKASAINEILEIGKVHFIDEIDMDEISYQFEKLNSSVSMEDVRLPDETFAIISHDLKNPLNAIRLEAQILLRHSRKEDTEYFQEDVRRSANRIIKTTDRLGILVSDLLDHGKVNNTLTSLTRTPTDALQLVEEVIEVVAPIAKRNSIKIKKKYLSHVSPFLADKNKVFQVLLNLLSNALKFSSQHTSVQMSVEEREGRVYFSVEDSGPGIDPEIELNLFQRYRAGNKRQCGSGLGLYICKTIVEAHQGQITFRKGPKGGTVFEFYLPKVMEQDETRKNKIYLLDSDDDLRDVLSWALNSEGHHVESFASIESVYSYLGTVTEKPALILSDFSTLKMTDEEIGEAIKKLKLDSVPLIFLTTRPEEVKTQIQSKHYAHILAKPFDLDAFMQTVSRFLTTTCTQPG